jgi:hypothetical protein
MDSTTAALVSHAVTAAPKEAIWQANGKPILPAPITVT